MSGSPPEYFLSADLELHSTSQLFFFINFMKQIEDRMLPYFLKSINILTHNEMKGMEMFIIVINVSTLFSD